MSNLFKQFQTDPEKEKDGIEVQYAPNDDGTVPTFRIARRANFNVKYRKALENATRPVRRLIELGSLDPAKDREIMMNVFITAILLGWKDVQDKDGKVIPYNQANALLLFKTLPDLYEDLNEQAGKASLFREESLESDSKN